MVAPRRLVSAVGATAASARAQIESLGPVLSNSPVPAPGEVPVWDGVSWVPGINGGGGGVLSSFLWNLDGAISAFPLQPGSFDGMLLTDPALVGPGPFNGARTVQVASTITLSGFFLRVATGPVTFVEVYRARAGLVASLILLGMGATGSAFSGVTTVPPIVDLLPGDLLFVSLAAAPVGSQDLSIFLQVTSP